MAEETANAVSVVAPLTMSASAAVVVVTGRVIVRLAAGEVAEEEEAEEDVTEAGADLPADTPRAATAGLAPRRRGRAAIADPDPPPRGPRSRSALPAPSER